MYFVRTLKLGRDPRIDTLAKITGELYSRVLVSFWRTVRRRGLWLKPSSLMRWHTDARIHAHTADAVVQQFCWALKSWRKRRKRDRSARPPRRMRRYARIYWKSSAIRMHRGTLLLSNGKYTAPLVVPWSFPRPAFVEIGWDGMQYELRAVYQVSPRVMPLGDQVAGIDLGEVHTAGVYDGRQANIINGRHLRSLRRYQNKLKAHLSMMIARKQRRSRRWSRLGRSKARQLRKLQNQILDVLHKQTSYIVSTLYERGVQTMAIGDTRGIRLRTNLGRKANQKVHQWLGGRARNMLTYKAARFGMNVALIDERYTTQTCPRCSNRSRAKGRIYRCKLCSEVYHRDVVGAVNIRAKYLGNFGSSVVGVHPAQAGMASPSGVRYSAHLRCSSLRPTLSGAGSREKMPGPAAAVTSVPACKVASAS